MTTFDLHTHTTFSDGLTSPEDNAALAAAAGLGGFALTDHDTVAGWERAAAAAAARGLVFVPGVELSTEEGDASVHVLGYWVDPAHPELVAECDRLRNEREHRAAGIVERLADLGVSVSLERIRALAGDAPIGRPHIAAALVEMAAVPDRAAAFDRYLADGGPAWVPKHALSPEQGVRLIRAAGGVAVLAHPGLEERYADVDGGLLERLCAAGLAGVEADHVGHSAEAAAHWRCVAAERELVVTGSSDFHGDSADVKIGDRSTSGAALAALRERAARGKENPW